MCTEWLAARAGLRRAEEFKAAGQASTAHELYIRVPLASASISSESSGPRPCALPFWCPLRPNACFNFRLTAHGLFRFAVAPGASVYTCHGVAVTTDRLLKVA